MTDVLVVRVAYGAHDLVEHVPGLVLCERAPVLWPLWQPANVIFVALSANIGW